MKRFGAVVLTLAVATALLIATGILYDLVYRNADAVLIVLRWLVLAGATVFLYERISKALGVGRDKRKRSDGGSSELSESE